MPSNLDNYNLRKGKPSAETWLINKLITMSKINLFLANWKTTLLGIGSICAALQDGFQMADIAVLTAAVGLIAGKDADKSNAQFPVAKATKVD